MIKSTVVVEKNDITLPKEMTRITENDIMLNNKKQ